MAVDDKAEAEQAIKERGGRARGHEGGARERDKTGGKQTLESPVMRSVRLVRRGESRRIVHGALVDRYSKRHQYDEKRKDGTDVRPPGT